MQDQRNWDSNAPLVIAHRGASMYAPENTLAAFNLAVEMGADAIELDTMLSADGVPVVFHDHSLARTTNGSGIVSHKTVEELKLLDAGSLFNRTYAGERIPTLEEVFSAMGMKVLINVELKNYASPLDRLPEAVVDLALENGLSDRILLSSFNPAALIKAQRAAPEVRRAALIGGGAKIVRAFFKVYSRYYALHPEVSLVTREVVKKYHAAGKKVNVWTINEESGMKKLIDMGVDGLITDAPDVARKVVESRNIETKYDPH